ncbi:MAG: vWA domain-containing protein [Micavibrio sp.]
MDEGQLKKILSESPVPSHDENARKTALNLALAEFDALQAEQRHKNSSKNFQGTSLWSRLIGRPHNMERRKTMNRKLVYGGMATAMVVVLAAGATMQQYYPAQVRSGSGDIMSQALERQDNALVEQAARTGSSAMPVPVESPEGQKVAGNEAAPMVMAEMSAEREVPLERWRQIQEPKKKDESFNGPASNMVTMEAKRMVAPASPAVSMGMADSSVGYIVVPEPIPQQSYQDVGRDKFEDFEENQVKLVQQEPVSTFSIDVDTSSYAFMRRQLNSGVLPQKDAVRVEELINYFDYNYPLPEDKAAPFKPSVTVMDSPWHEGRKLVHIGIKGYDIDRAENPRSNLVFLLDTSGSMNSPDKLPLLINSLKMLLDSLNPDDSVAIVTYAGSAGTVLEPTKVADKAKIIAALENLNAGGSTAGAEGIRQAYALAEAGFNKDAVNRVILATDGDFNVGITNPEELQDFVERKRESGIFLSVFGFGQGNYNDQIMQTLAQNGNGVAAYIDTLNEARKVLVEEASSTLFTIAKDVKIQVEFNPQAVSEYRLVGYETRKLNREDFNNDKVDAGDIGAGHTVTAIYEINPVAGGARAAVDPLRYGAADDLAKKGETSHGEEYGFLKIRYKLPHEDVSKLIETPIKASSGETISDDVRFGVAVASYGQMLKGGKYTGTLTYDDVIDMAQKAKGSDEFGYRAEFINLVRLSKTAAGLPDTQP